MAVDNTGDQSCEQLWNIINITRSSYIGQLMDKARNVFILTKFKSNMLQILKIKMYGLMTNTSTNLFKLSTSLIVIEKSFKHYFFEWGELKFSII